jgi:hypothetical protein
MNLRKTTSLTTLLSFILLLITSVVLYVTPQGKVAYWANWKMMGIGKETWGALHTNIGILFVVAGVVHTVLNWKAIVTYMKKAQKLRVFTPDFSLALVITLAVTFLTLFELPPLSAIQHHNALLKFEAAQKYGDPPYGHAESSTLKEFCSRTGLSMEESIQKLEEAGLKAVSATATLAEISEANGIPPQAVYNLMAPAGGKTSEHGSKGGGMGFGKKTLEAVCTENDLDPQQILQKLREQGIDAARDQSIRDLADKAGMNPSQLREMILPTATP